MRQVEFGGVPDIVDLELASDSSGRSAQESYHPREDKREWPMASSSLRLPDDPPRDFEVRTASGGLTVRIPASSPVAAWALVVAVGLGAVAGAAGVLLVAPPLGERVGVVPAYALLSLFYLLFLGAGGLVSYRWVHQLGLACELTLHADRLEVRRSLLGARSRTRVARAAVREVRLETHASVVSDEHVGPVLLYSALLCTEHDSLPLVVDSPFRRRAEWVVKLVRSWVDEPG